MDAYSFYLSTFRYVMNADPREKSTWCDIFKYLPCLRQMLSCCVCGSIVLRPQGPTHGVCLHHVCESCLGGTMRLKPSCSWCKDHNKFEENKKLRVLILCFKRLCAYISDSSLGTEITKSLINGCGHEAERTLKVLEEADKFEDDFKLTPPPSEIPSMSKAFRGGFKLSFDAPRPSTSKTESSKTASSSGNTANRPTGNNINLGVRKQRGRPKSVKKLSLKSSASRSNAVIHVKRLKKRALKSGTRKRTTGGNNNKTPLISSLTKQKKQLPKPREDTSHLLISQRPHRHRSGKCSVGQLWRETFLEEYPPEIYPDSGIEVGNLSDQDHGAHSLPPPLTKQVNVKSLKTIEDKPEPVYKDTRLHRASENKGELSVNAVSSTTDETQEKPRLTLTISKKRLEKFSRRAGSRLSQNGSVRSHRARPAPLTGELSSVSQLGSKERIRKCMATARKSLKQRADICRCARFKNPNHLTCLGQKCPCYSDRRPCVDCLCNGCKNPRRAPDSAPPLMHVLRDSGTPDAKAEPSMPRLSPIPRM